VDGNAFVDGWVIQAVCEKLEDVSNGRVKRLVINLPPGFSKTTLTGVMWPAWDWITKPWRRWSYVSYDHSLMNRYSSKLIDLVTSPWFIERWGKLIPVSNPAQTEFRTNKDGGRFNTSFKGRATGRHCHIQVFDDPHKPLHAMGGVSLSYEETWDLMANTFASRAVNPETFSRVIVMQRLHPEDASGKALAAGWSSLRFPMRFEADNRDPCDRRTEDGEVLNPKRMSPAACDSLEKELEQVDATIWPTQYQQRPTSKAGQIIQAEWILANTVGPDDVRSIIAQREQSWDLSFKDAQTSDFIAGQYWGARNGHFFMFDEPVFELASFLQTLARIRAKREEWPCFACLVEDKANGPAIINVLKSEGASNVEPITPEGSKSERLHAVSPLFKKGRVHFLRGPWLDRMVKTFSKFPAVRRDDEVDACTQALLHLNGGSAMIQQLTDIARRLGRGA
jgi:predicted phage terminase large subunit-like protein